MSDFRISINRTGGTKVVRTVAINTTANGTPVWIANGSIGIIGATIDGGGSAITTGIKGDIGPFTFPCNIEDVTLIADQTGSIVIDLWKCSYANFPPVAANTITASAKPTISGGIKSQDTTLTGWTTTIAVGDIIRCNVNSVSSIQRVTLAMNLTRT